MKREEVKERNKFRKAVRKVAQDMGAGASIKFVGDSASIVFTKSCEFPAIPAIKELSFEANQMTKFTELWDWPEDFKKKHGI